jgi:hypothetical protein
VGDGVSSVGLAFGAMERGADSRWSLLPLRLVYRSGDRSITVGLNGLSFLLRGGVTVGRPVAVTEPRTGDVISIGGRVTVSSRVEGDVWTLGADIELGPRAEVTGDVVALGGRVIGNAKAAVRGAVSELPEVKIPFLGILGTQFSVQALGMARQILGYLLLSFALFLSSFYRTPAARLLCVSVGAGWREALITLAVSLVAAPLAVTLLIVSVVGIFFLPVLVFTAGVMALEGFLMLCVGLGGALRRGGKPEAAEPLWLFTSGLLGLFLVKVPGIAGIFVTLLGSAPAARVGQILQLVTLGATAAGLFYGMALSLVRLRAQARGRAAAG